MERDKHIKSTDWLIKGYSEEELARIKAEAIKEAEAELRDKQIEEMAKFVCNACEMGCGFEGECSNFNDYKTCGISVETAKALYDAGYRKASEVAREIFEEIEKIRLKEIHRCETFRERENEVYERKYWEGGYNSLRQLSYWLAELKKKYTEGEK